MNLRSKLALGAATFALACGLAGASQAADPAGAPAATPAPATMPAPVAGKPLADIQNPKQALVGAKVNDSKGEAVGEVKSVKLGPDGKVASVSVGIGTKTYALEANSLTFAEADKTLTSAQTKAEIQALPPT
jgi:hypothetical protein